MKSVISRVLSSKKISKNFSIFWSQHTCCISASMNNGFIPKSEHKNEKGWNSGYYKHEQQPLYDGHIPTSLFQKCLLAVGSSFCSITNPYRHDMIAVFGETTGIYAASKMREKMVKDPEGKIILREKPRINSETLNYQYLEQLPEDTFGHAYLKFLRKNNVTPDTRQPVHFVDDSEVAYVIQRYREVHDLLHTLLGMPTNMLGEVSIKWVEAIQTGLPMCVAGAVLGPLRLKSKQRQKYIKEHLSWAINCGFKAKFLMNIYFEKRWHQELESLRYELRIPNPPSVIL